MRETWASSGNFPRLMVEMEPGMDRDVLFMLRRRIEDAVDEDEIARENIAVNGRDRSTKYAGWNALSIAVVGTLDGS
jgi:hypothetical protein